MFERTYERKDKRTKEQMNKSYSVVQKINDDKNKCINNTNDNDK